MLEDAEVGGVHSRVITVPMPDGLGGAVQLARPLTEIDQTLAGLGLLLGLVAVVGWPSRRRWAGPSPGLGCPRWTG